MKALQLTSAMILILAFGILPYVGAVIVVLALIIAAVIGLIKEMPQLAQAIVTEVEQVAEEPDNGRTITRIMAQRKIEIDKIIERIEEPEDIQPAWDEIAKFKQDYHRHKKMPDIEFDFDWNMMRKRLIVMGY